MTILNFSSSGFCLYYKMILIRFPNPVLLEDFRWSWNPDEKAQKLEWIDQFYVPRTSRQFGSPESWKRSNAIQSEPFELFEEKVRLKKATENMKMHMTKIVSSQGESL